MKVNLSIQDPTLEQSALYLALSDNRAEEEHLKKQLAENGFACGVTEIGGTATTLQPNGKLVNSVISAAINTGVIQKDSREIHALVHAALEASNSIFIHTNSNASFALKVGLVTDSKWVAVAIFGRSSLHPLSEHGRVGLGIMHL